MSENSGPDPARNFRLSERLLLPPVEGIASRSGLSIHSFCLAILCQVKPGHLNSVVTARAGNSQGSDVPEMEKGCEVHERTGGCKHPSLDMNHRAFSLLGGKGVFESVGPGPAVGDPSVSAATSTLMNAFLAQ